MVAWLRRVARPTPLTAVVVVVALVSALVVLGEPSRPATATILRPIVTVPALCSAPTVVDVAARDATRGLTAVGQLLGLDAELVGEAARDLRIVDTDAGTFFVLARDGLLRVAALSPAGLPIVNTEGETPQTHRAFALGGDLAAEPPLVVNGSEGVFVVIGGPDRPVRVLALTPTTLASSVDLSLASDAVAPVIAAPDARPGAAVVRDGVLWLVGDDGRVVSFDPFAEGQDRWVERADDAAAPLLARGESSVIGVFTADRGVELRSFRADGAGTPIPVRSDVREVTAVTYPDSAVPAFAVVTDDGAGLLRTEPDQDGTASLVPTMGVDGDLLGLVATDGAAALVTAVAGGLRYRVVDRAGAEVGDFAAGDGERCVSGPWPDAATSIQPTSAGQLMHLHDPSAPRDCVVDTADTVALAEVTERCRADGEWSVDKGSAPARDFTVEIGRALDELTADELEDRLSPEELGTSADALQEELGDAGIEVVETEVDPDVADECAAEVVGSVAPPVLDLAEAIGSRSIRVEWTWSGGTCLPGRYVVTSCLLGEQGSACVDSTDTEVGANRQSARSATQLPALPDRTYRISVRAFKGAVSSAPSGALLVTTPAATPDPPTGVSGVLAGGAWQLAWSSCLVAGSCEQRPDGYLVSVEGCEGDGLGLVTRRFDASQRGVSFAADGTGFADVDLLGRRVQFRVATTAGERTSPPVAAGGCTESVRPGRDGSAGALGISLTGRSRQVTMAPVDAGRALVELFGTPRFDDVAARLLRGGTGTAARTGVTSQPVTFDVDRCVPEGWTVELTPRRGGQDLPAHRSRLTGAVVACDPSVSSSTTVSVNATGSSSSGIDLRVRVPELGQDVRNGLVSGVSGTASCDRAFGGGDSLALSGGTIVEDDVSFRMPVPVILDLSGGCQVQVTVAFTGGGSAAPAAQRVDLARAADVIAPLVVDVAAASLDRARTGRYEGRRVGQIGLGGNRDVVAVRHDGSGVPCNRTYGSTTWRFEVHGTDLRACADGAHEILYQEQDLDDRGRGQLEIRASVLTGGSAAARVQRTVDVCGLPSGEPRPPCAPAEPPCEFDPDLPADHPACPEPCPFDPSVPVTDPTCPEPCEHDPSIPSTDPGCVPPGPPPSGPRPGAAPSGATPPSTSPSPASDPVGRGGP